MEWLHVRKLASSDGVSARQEKEAFNVFFCCVCIFFCQSGETETLTHRLEEAEKALALKQAHIDKLKEEVEQQRTLQETIEVLTAQVSRQKKKPCSSFLHKCISHWYI